MVGFWQAASAKLPSRKTGILSHAKFTIRLPAAWRAPHTTRGARDNLRAIWKNKRIDPGGRLEPAEGPEQTGTTGSMPPPTARLCALGSTGAYNAQRQKTRVDFYELRISAARRA